MNTTREIEAALTRAVLDAHRASNTTELRAYWLTPAHEVLLTHPDSKPKGKAVHFGTYSRDHSVEYIVEDAVAAIGDV